MFQFSAVERCRQKCNSRSFALTSGSEGAIFFRFFVRLEKTVGEFFPATLWVVIIQPILRLVMGLSRRLEERWAKDCRGRGCVSFRRGLRLSISPSWLLFAEILFEADFSKPFYNKVRKWRPELLPFLSLSFKNREHFRRGLGDSRRSGPKTGGPEK